MDLKDGTASSQNLKHSCSFQLVLIEMVALAQCPQLTPIEPT
jgi:hypothetical protein